MDVNLELFDFKIIIITLFFALILFPAVHTISNSVTKLGTYHKEEPFWFERLFKLYHTYLFLSIPLIVTIFIILSQNLGLEDPYKISFISFGASFMIPLMGRLCSISEVKLFDGDAIREKERMLSFVFSIIVGTLIIAVLILIYKLTFYKTMFNINISGTYINAIIIIVMFFVLPLIATLIGEGLLRVIGVCSKIKI